MRSRSAISFWMRYVLAVAYKPTVGLDQGRLRCHRLRGRCSTNCADQPAEASGFVAASGASGRQATRKQGQARCHGDIRTFRRKIFSYHSCIGIHL
jgi:hypothetical protein